MYVEVCRFMFLRRLHSSPGIEACFKYERVGFGLLVILGMPENAEKGPLNKPFMPSPKTHLGFWRSFPFQTESNDLMTFVQEHKELVRANSFPRSYALVYLTIHAILAAQLRDAPRSVEKATRKKQLNPQTGENTNATKMFVKLPMHHARTHARPVRSCSPFQWHCFAAC